MNDLVGIHNDNRYKQEQYFSEIFRVIWKTGAKFQAPLNLATSFIYSITYYVKFTVFQFFERVNKGELKIVNIILKIDRSSCILMSLKSS